MALIPVRQILAFHDTNHKQYLVSGIVDHDAFKKLYPRHVGRACPSLCMRGYDGYVKRTD